MIYERAITQEEIKEICFKYSANYIETSAKDSVNIDLAVETLASEIWMNILEQEQEAEEARKKAEQEAKQQKT